MSRKHRTPARLGLVCALIVMIAAVAGPVAAQNEVSTPMARGHVALDRSQYRNAADLFQRAADQAGSEQEQAEALYWRAFALSRLESKRDLQRAAEALLQLRQLSPDPELLRESRTLAARIKGQLARQGDATAARELAEMAEEQDDLELKLAALEAMMHMNPERALPVLTKIVQNREPGTVELRRRAMFLISQGNAEGAEDVLIDAARNDPDPEVRQQATFWLAHIESPRVLEFFHQLIRTEQEPEVLEAALFAISQMDSDDANDILRQLAAAPESQPEVRQMAIFGLGVNGSPEDRAFLRSIYGEIADEEAREHILHAVAQHDDPGTADWLVDIALDEDQDIEPRKMALFWAGQQGLLPVDRLETMYGRIDDREMREQIIFVLSQDGGDEAVRVLMGIARSESDLELRKQAIFWIGQSGAKGAEDLLLEIIND